MAITRKVGTAKSRGKSVLHIELSPSILAKIGKLSAEVDLPVSSYVRLLLSQHIRTPFKIELQRNAS